MKIQLQLFLFSVLLIAVIAGCSSKTDQEYFDEAQKYFQQDNIPEAVTSYETLVNEFPDSKLAPKAMMQLAGIYQSKKLTNLSEQELIIKANEYYMEVFEKYPASEDAPTALFMAGFLQANEMNDYPQATKTYNTFLERYPDNEMAVAAKQELENMGLSPEEILRKNLVKQE